MAEPIYPKDSVGISVPIKVDGVIITTSYLAGDPMSNSAIGFGKAWFSVFDSTGAIVSDASNTVLQDVIMFRDTLSSGTAVYTIGPGLLSPGTYSIQPFYSVNTTGGSLNWRKQAVISVTIAPLGASTDVP